MKKKFLCFIGALALILMGVLCLSACNTNKKIYFTFESPLEHTSVSTNNCGQDKNGNTYVFAGEELIIYVSVDPGYYSDDFKLFINSQEVELTTNTDAAGNVAVYEYTLTPTENLEITFSGSFSIIRKTLSIKKENGTYDEWEEPFDATLPQNSEVFIRFGENNVLGFPSTERTYANFMTFNTILKPLNYGQSFDFYVYTKGLKGEPMLFSLYNTTASDILLDLKEEFYHEGDNIGYHYTYTQTYYDGDLIFHNASFNLHTSISTAESSSSGNKKMGSEKLVIEIAPDLSELTITINNYNALSQAIKASFADLKLKINDVLQDVDFTNDDDGVFVLTLKKPYEYVADDGYIYPFQYNVNLNFYTLEYFEGEQLDSMEQL